MNQLEDALVGRLADEQDGLAQEEIRGAFGEEAVEAADRLWRQGTLARWNEDGDHWYELKRPEASWWNNLQDHPIDQVERNLREIPADHRKAALDALLALPSSYPHILKAEIHRFLQAEVPNITKRPRPGTLPPLAVSHVAYLLHEGDLGDARDLLEWLPEASGSELSEVVAYLRYVSEEHGRLAGTTTYSGLTAEDLFLGVCYWTEEGQTPDVLEDQQRWSYHAVENAFLDHGDPQAWNRFKVRGLQPRIAELAFRRIHALLAGSAADGLRDLNREHVEHMERPWALGPTPGLPPVDWQAGDGTRYDVKSNVFYRSYRERNGLRGFLIEGIKRSQADEPVFPGIVFTQTDDETCSWVYVGEYDPVLVPDPSSDRVLPFLFCLPEAARFSRNIDSPAEGMELLHGRSLPLGWQLASGARIEAVPRDGTAPSRLLHALLDEVLAKQQDTFLEYALWEALTGITFEALGAHRVQDVQAFLALAKEFVDDRALPVHLPRIDGTTIVGHWISDVLEPLATHWTDVRCTGCGASAREPDTLQLSVNRMTSGGTIWGRIACARCDHVRSEATLLTHCHDCGHFPLIIGKNQVCETCEGLVCTWEDTYEPRGPCGHCKPSCA